MPSATWQYLLATLAHIEQESFGPRAAPRVSLSSETHEDNSGAVSGVIEIRIRTRTGEEPLIRRESFSGLACKDDVHDMLARTLSVLLMNHPDWPR